MKKKCAFTLVEVLITLTVIGIVAALASPALNTAIQKSKVGPSLRKFISTMENANEHLLGDAEENTLSPITNNSSDVYCDRLKRYIKGNTSGTAPSVLGYTKSAITLPEDGKVFNFARGDSMYVALYEPSAEEANQPNGSYKGHCGVIYYDLNGFDTAPNSLGKDIFEFYIDNGGTIIPRASKMDRSVYPDHEENKWSDSCSAAQITGDGHNCAGSVADNGWKVIYKY